MNRIPMRRRAFLLTVPVLLGALLPPHPGKADSNIVTDQTRMVDKAANVIERLRNSGSMGKDFSRRLSSARAILIVPELVRGGFILGAEYGTGVLLSRDGSGRWSGPAFYSVTSGSIGLQIGVQDAETVFLITSDAGLRAVMYNNMKIGADASVAVAHVGAGTQAATTTNAGADIYAYSRAAGAYGGASLAGSGITSRAAWNAAYYGGNPAPEDILIRRSIDSPQADRLRDILAR